MNRIFSLVYEYKSITLNIKGFIYSLNRGTNEYDQTPLPLSKK